METVKLGEQSEGHEDGLSRINVKSDFPLAMKLIKDGQEVPFPETDFSVTARTEGGFLVYKAGRKNSIYKHCKQDGDRMIIFFDNHGLGKGRVVIECVIDTPDADYTEDGIRQEAYKAKSPIVLVDDDGDALDLRLPEPRVVEKEIDHYTDLQKKAADWVSRLIAENWESGPEELEKVKMVLSGIFKFVDYGGLSSIYLSPSSSGGNLFNGVSSSDEDFKDRLELAKFLISGIGRSGTSDLFSNLNAPELDLEVFISVGSEVSLNSLFYGSTLNTITINAEGTDFQVDSASSLEEKLEMSKGLSMFISCTAKKVSVVSRAMMNANYGWYILPSIFGSNVECFDFSGGGETKNKTFEISNIIERFLPDVTEEDHKPNLIFRDYTGEVTEELKQKVLAKGYPSVEFYLGDEKML